MTKNFAVIRVRGKLRLNPHVKDTLATLGLKNVNNCVILSDTPVNRGQIRAVNDYVTWGEIEDETLKVLKEKKGEKERKAFRLHPPKKGWERGGIIHNYKAGGALGYRGVEINKLIGRMMK